MMGATTGLEKSVKCTAAITEAFTIAKFGADDDTLSLATGVGDDLVGIFQHTTENAGDEVRVRLGNISDVKFGGNVTRGDWLTSDANGRAVAAAPATGVNNNVIGIALVSGVSGDIGPALIKQGQIQGA
jgi:hypothetical protein